jgi:hypothetical protein
MGLLWYYWLHSRRSKKINNPNFVLTMIFQNNIESAHSLLQQIRIRVTSSNHAILPLNIFGTLKMPDPRPGFIIKFLKRSLIVKFI